MKTARTQSPDGQRVIEYALQNHKRVPSDEGPEGWEIDATAVAEKLSLPLEFVCGVLDDVSSDPRWPLVEFIEIEAEPTECEMCCYLNTRAATQRVRIFVALPLEYEDTRGFWMELCDEHAKEVFDAVVKEIGGSSDG